MSRFVSLQTVSSPAILSSNRSGLILAATIFALLLGSRGPVWAHEPGTIAIALAKAADSGPLSFLPDLRGKGDTRLDYTIKNDDPEVDAIIVFPACSFEGDGQKREQVFQVENLAAVLAGTEKAVPVQPDAQWGLCQLTKSELPGVYLLRRGQTLRLQMALDFLPGALVGVSDPGKSHLSVAVHSYFDMFAIDPDDTSALAEALLLSSRPKAGVIGAYLKKISAGRRGDARQWFSVFYAITPDLRATTGVFRRTTYEDLFHPASLADDPALATGLEAQEVVDAAQVFALEDYKEPKRIIPDSGLIYDPDHSSVLQIDSSSAGPDGGQVCVEERPDCVLYPTLCQSGGGSISQGPSPGIAGSSAQSASASPRGTAYGISGQFSVKWTDHALHPGWGWRAVAYWNNAGTWTELASDWVQWDGSYVLNVSYPGYSGQNLRVQFRAYNAFFEPRTQANNLFRWKNSDKTNISTNHDEGHHYADCDGGAANGLGEMYFGGYLLWSDMSWRGDISPLRANPLHVYFPNTWYNCGTVGGSPWSCAMWNGDVWLIAAHGVQNDVVQHEFAHQVHYEFWNNNFPTGACLSHNICTSYNEGLALTEGYADFVPAWIGCNRGDASCTASNGTEMETNACGSATNKNNREWYVAQTFHDLWDSHADGDDVLWYVNEGSPHKLFLSNGLAAGGSCGGGAGAVSRGMDDYQNIYRNNCSAGHQGYIDDIFEQNLN